MEAYKRGGKAKKTMKQKQKQSVVIKNVINIGERKPKPMNRRQKRARKQQVRDGRVPTGGGAVSGGNTYLGPGAQYPMSRLFQVQSNEPRSLTMTSADANEKVNNVSALIDKAQQITEGKLIALMRNELELDSYKRQRDAITTKPFIEEYVDEEDEEQPQMEAPPQIEPPKQKEEEVVVEDVVEEKKEQLLPDVEQQRETIVKEKKPKSSSSSRLRIEKTAEEKRTLENIQSRKRMAKTVETYKRAEEEEIAYKDLLLKRRADEKIQKEELEKKIKELEKSKIEIKTPSK